MTRHRSAAFTILEMLIAGTIAALLILSATLLYGGSSRLARTAETNTRSAVQLHVATRILQEDLRQTRPNGSQAHGTANDGACATIATLEGEVRYCNAPGGATRQVGDESTRMTPAGGSVVIERVGKQYRVRIRPEPEARETTFVVSSRLEEHQR